MKIKSLFCAGSMVLAMAAAAGSVRAASLFQEEFPGPALPSEANGSFTATGLVHTGLATLGGAVQASGFYNGAGLTLPTSYGFNYDTVNNPSNTLYASFLEDAPNGVAFGNINFTPNQGFYSGGQLNYFDNHGALASGDATLFIVKFVFNSATSTSISVWVNPADFSSEGASPTATDPNNHTISSGIVFNGVGISSGYYSTQTLDEVRIGTTYADVTPAPVVVAPSVPEPASIGLLAVSALGLLARRSRK